MPPGETPNYKGQPWVLFDTVAARSFLLGDTVNGLAIGSNVPAISAAGELQFFNAPGRNTQTTPWYTNLDQQSMLSYGMEVWQIYLLFMMPAMPPIQNIGYDFESNAGVPGTVKLIEAILNFGELELLLGQEWQLSWPLSRFGAGGGIYLNGGAGVTNIAQNSVPEGANVMKLPESIEMIRTQNLAAKIRIAPEATQMIGTVAAPGVGQPLSPYVYGIDVVDDVPVLATKVQLPFALQLGLVGRRIKNTQYGQLAPGAGA